jgi:hypothetical protein
MGRINLTSMSPRKIKAKLAEHDQALDGLDSTGGIPSARLNMAVNPSNGDTFTIDGNVFKTVTALAAATTFTQVKIGTSAAATLASSINAVNGTTDVTVVQATTPLASLVVADLIDSTHMRVRQAESRGGLPVDTSAVGVAVSQSMTDAGNIWNRSKLGLDTNGVIPSARLNMASIPTNNDTFLIGGHTFKFVTSLGAATTFTQITIGASAAASRTSAINAINGTTDATVVQATTPFAGLVVADLIDTSRIRVREADARGGNPVAESPISVAVSETLTAGADVWDRANLNETGEATGVRTALGSIIITAQHITATKVYIDFPFTPQNFSYTVRSATGAILPCTDLVTIEGSAIKIALAGGAAPNLVATNVVSVTVTG